MTKAHLRANTIFGNLLRWTVYALSLAALVFPWTYGLDLEASGDGPLVWRNWYWFEDDILLFLMPLYTILMGLDIWVEHRRRLIALKVAVWLVSAVVSLIGAANCFMLMQDSMGNWGSLAASGICLIYTLLMIKEIAPSIPSSEPETEEN